MKILIPAVLFVSTAVSAKCLNHDPAFPGSYLGGMQNTMVVAPTESGYVGMPMTDYVCSQYYILNNPVVRINVRGGNTRLRNQVVTIDIMGRYMNSGNPAFTRLARISQTQFQPLQSDSENFTPASDLERVKELVSDLQASGYSYVDSAFMNPGNTW
ncbi:MULTISPECIES: hypothetical protein [Enterobacteriaceae]|nr:MULTISPECIES: hypothetical protein [Enterobacteriaceae]